MEKTVYTTRAAAQAEADKLNRARTHMSQGTAGVCADYNMGLATGYFYIAMYSDD